MGPPSGYLARPVTTVWAQGTMISLKLPWSKNPLCQDPFRAVGRSVEAQAGGWLLEGPGCPPGGQTSAVSLGQPDIDSPDTFIPGKQQHFPLPTPYTQNQGCQTIYQIRKSVHTEHPTTSTSFHAKHEETLVTVSAFSSQGGKKSRWLPSEGTISEGAILLRKHSSRTWGLQPQNRYAGKNVFHWETERQRKGQ